MGELAAAEDLIYSAADVIRGRACARGDYARGVEHALMWARFATATPTPAATAHPPAPRARIAPTRAAPTWSATGRTTETSAITSE